MSVIPSSRIDRVLQDVVDDAPSYGLDYAVYLPAGVFDGAFSPQSLKHKARGRFLKEKLGRYGFVHTPDEQLNCWDQLIEELHKSLQIVSGLSTDAGTRGMTATRLVLDVEMGGLLYAVVRGGGWLFAATLDQQSMNDGRAEKSLIKLARDLDALDARECDPPRRPLD
jgi:hypothetical protein